MNLAIYSELDHRRRARPHRRAPSRRSTRSPTRATASKGNVAPALALEAMLVSRPSRPGGRAVIRGRTVNAPPRLAAIAVARGRRLLLSGCMSWFRAAARAEHHLDADRRAGRRRTWQPFYDQVLDWTGCGDGMQCATATAPMDWDDPRRRQHRARAGPPAGHRHPARIAARQPRRPGRLRLRLHPRQRRLRDERHACSELRHRRLRPARGRRSTAVELHDDPAVPRRSTSTASCPATPGSDAWIAASSRPRTPQFGAGLPELHRPAAAVSSTRSAPRATSTCCARCSATRSSTTSATRTAPSSARPTPSCTRRRPGGSCSTARSTRRPASST